MDVNTSRSIDIYTSAGGFIASIPVRTRVSDALSLVAAADIATVALSPTRSPTVGRSSARHQDGLDREGGPRSRAAVRGCLASSLAGWLARAALNSMHLDCHL